MIGQRAALAVCAALVSSIPSSVLACPMCFTGGNSNSQAFVWGSLLLMFVPVTAIGSLLYWAYRRAQAGEPRHPARAETNDSDLSVRVMAESAAGRPAVRNVVVVSTRTDG
jgi:hypothetical protein